MPARIHPQRSVVPIVRSSATNPVMQLLGTGFFVGNDTSLHVVTAKHVFLDNPLRDGEVYAIGLEVGDGKMKFAGTPSIDGHPHFDIAACLFSRDDLPKAVSLPISSTIPPLNQDILAWEYSSTRIEQSIVAFMPLTHKGNIVLAFDSDYPEKIITPSLLTSFPALQGASGAPLLSDVNSNFAAVGMLVTNVEQHLIPAQTVTIHEGDDYKEETKYFLPYGKAIQGAVVARCLQELKIPFTPAAPQE